jgi:heme A synthase
MDDDTPIAVPRAHRLAVLLVFSLAALVALSMWLLDSSSTLLHVAGLAVFALVAGTVAIGVFALGRGYSADAERELLL